MSATRYPARIRRSKDLLGVSAVTFLTLCMWLGPPLACSLLIIVAIMALWFFACRRWPIVAWFTAGFIRGLMRR
jgi:hypothetical protein